MAKVSVVGAGSWGTALAMLLCNNGHDTMLWSHREEQAEEQSTERAEEHEERAERSLENDAWERMKKRGIID